METLFGGIEAGGTKCVCAIASSFNNIRALTQFPTTTPTDTIQHAITFFKDQIKKHGQVKSIGIGSFGPLDPDPQSSTYGSITSTPKPGWSNIDFAGVIRSALNVPVGFDTDVNAAALGEARGGAAQGLTTFLYVTVGTGIGGGGLINGKLLHGLVHAEMGHIRIPHDYESDPFPGICSFHGDCLEGLASGPAMKMRWGQAGEFLPPTHQAWPLEAHYLALGLMNFICTLSPQRIVLGGGVMNHNQLYPMVRTRVLSQLNDYIRSPAIREEIEKYIVPPALGSEAGVLGAIALAQEVADTIA